MRFQLSRSAAPLVWMVPLLIVAVAGTAGAQHNRHDARVLREDPVTLLRQAIISQLSETG